MILTFRLRRRHRYLCCSCNLYNQMHFTSTQCRKMRLRPGLRPGHRCGNLQRAQALQLILREGKGRTEGNGKGRDGNWKGKGATWAEELSKVWGRDTLARKYMYEKLTKFPNFTRCLPEKYFPDFSRRGSGKCPYPLVSYTYLWRAGEGREVSWNRAGDWLRPALV